MSQRIKARLFLLPGALHGSWSFEPMIPFLRNKYSYDCISIDYPRSIFPSPPTKFESYVSHTKNIIQNAAVSSPPSDDIKNIVIGHSMGGLVALNSSEAASPHVNGIVFIAGLAYMPGESAITTMMSHPNESHKIHQEAMELFDIDIGDIKIDNAYCEMRKEYIREMFYNDCNDEQYEWCLEMLKDVKEINFSSQVAIWTQENVGKLEKLYIQCSKDNMLPHETQKILCDNLELSEKNDSVSVLDSGHTPMVSQPKQLCKCIDDWIQKKFQSD